MAVEETELARRLVACKHFRLKPGMWDSELWLRCVAVFDDGSSLWAGDETTRRMRAEGDVTPDLADPATLGCLLARVREAWGNSKLSASVDYADRWHLCRGFDPAFGVLTDGHETEAEALVAALEAAP